MRIAARHIFKYATVAAAVGGCVVAAMVAGRAMGPDAPRWTSIVPPLLAVTLALLSGRIRVSLAAAVVAGGFLAAIDASSGVWAWFVDGLRRTWLYVAKTVWSPGDNTVNADNVQILLYVVLIMAMIAVILGAGGLQGVARWLERRARSARSTQLVTALLGLAIFIDDYANTMIVGATMRPMTDRQRISREKLAFLVDATAAPIAGIAILSTWIGYEVGLLSETAASLGVDKSGYEIFFDAIGFRFYCILMIAFVLMNVLSGQDYGPMGAAERRARDEGKLLADGAQPITSEAFASAQPHPAAKVRASVAIVPMVVVLVVFLGGIWIDGRGDAPAPANGIAILQFSAWRAALGEASTIWLLVVASAVGLGLAVAMSAVVARVPLASVAKTVLLGVRASLLPVSVLLLAWALKGACDDLRTGEFLAASLGDSISPWVFPAIVFVIAAVTSFATGTSWGTMAILIPTAIPVAFHLDGGVFGVLTVMSVAAVLDGAIFGDHCSPISDTTIMSSTASSCDHMAHVRTQIPYSLTVGAAALGLGYLPCALGLPGWLGLASGLIVLMGLFVGMYWCRSRSRGGSSKSGGLRG